VIAVPHGSRSVRITLKGPAHLGMTELFYVFIHRQKIKTEPCILTHPNFGNMGKIMTLIPFPIFNIQPGDSPTEYWKSG